MKTKELSLKYHLLSPEVRKSSPPTLRAVVETPRGSRHKFALDPKIGAITLKQTLASGFSWPYDYGFIPSTLGQDGDPLDMLVLMDEPTFPGCILTVRLLGVIGLRKNGVENDRFVGSLIPSVETSLSTDGYNRIEDLPQKLLHEVEEFLKNYSEEKGNRIELTGVRGPSEALTAVAAGQRAFEDAAK